MKYDDKLLQARMKKKTPSLCGDPRVSLDTCDSAWTADAVERARPFV